MKRDRGDFWYTWAALMISGPVLWNFFSVLGAEVSKALAPVWARVSDVGLWHTIDWWSTALCGAALVLWGLLAALLALDFTKPVEQVGETIDTGPYAHALDAD